MTPIGCTLIAAAGIVLGIAIAKFLPFLFSRDPKGPFISTQMPCPACGNLGCTLTWDMPGKLVYRKCKTCGCTITQPPVAPELFEKPVSR